MVVYAQDDTGGGRSRTEVMAQNDGSKGRHCNQTLGGILRYIVFRGVLWRPAIGKVEKTRAGRNPAHWS